MEHSSGDHIFSHKSSLGKFEKTETVLNTSSNHNSMRLEIIGGKKNCKNTNTSRPNNMLLNTQEINEEIKEEIKKYLEGLPWWFRG